MYSYWGSTAYIQNFLPTGISISGSSSRENSLSSDCSLGVSLSSRLSWLFMGKLKFRPKNMNHYFFCKNSGQTVFESASEPHAKASFNQYFIVNILPLYSQANQGYGQ